MNKVFRIIWNNSLGLWVVTSEIGRGKIKSATSKALTSAALSAIISSPGMAGSCDVMLLTCESDKQWSALNNNFNNGEQAITDGGHYTFTGPTIFNIAQGSGIAYSNINDIINAGYSTGPLVSEDSIKISLGNLSKAITVYDPITKSNKTVAVYDSSAMSESYSASQIGGIPSLIRPGPLDVYVKSRLLTVTEGVADINVAASKIGGGVKNSQFIYVDGTGNSKAEANWTSSNQIIFATEANVNNEPAKTYNIVEHTYIGSLSAFDGSEHVINTLADFKSYNNWLISKISNGDLNYTDYSSELQKAYTTATTAYVINRIPTDADMDVINEPQGVVALLSGNGSNALVRLSEGASLYGDARGVGGTDSSVFRLENGATGINDGKTEFVTYTAVVKSGSTFINNNSIISGLRSNGSRGTGVYISDQGSKFINNGTLSVNPTYSQPSLNSDGIGLTLEAGATATNNKVINVGITEGDKGLNALSKVFGVKVLGAKSNFTNAKNSKINIGFSEEGSGIYIKPLSSGIYANGTSLVDNQGVITMGKKTDGAIAIQAYGTLSGSNIINSGQIVIDSNGDNGTFIAQTNVGILASAKAKGVSNTGSIDINGTNIIGLKSVGGAKIQSSGTININHNSASLNDLRNYGVWSEDLDSLIDISGEVNLKGDGAIGIHARSQGAINISGTGKVNFSNGENQIGYYIYGIGSKINNTSTGSQDVTTNNSTLMRLDGGATFTGAAGATSTMGASGNNSTVIVATGSGTNINSGGMTLNVNGQNATGILVEGGATGTITNMASINLTGAGAIAGIADGQGHDLTGVATTMTDAQKKATMLTAAASLSSNLDEIVGYIARNLATLTNSGDINFSGRNTTGIQVAEGASGANSGNIVLGGAGSVGLVATANATETKLSSTGSLNLNGDWDGTDLATRATGVLAQGEKVDVAIGDGITAAYLNLHGAGSVGVHAKDGSNVVLNDKVAVNFDANKSDQIGFWVDGDGSAIETQANGTQTPVVGDGATLFYVTNHAHMEGDLNTSLTGKVGSNKTTSALRVNGAGSDATLGGNSHLTIGNNAIGVLAEDAGKVVIESGANFTTSGAGAVVGKSTGESSLVENNAAVTSLAGSSDSTAFLAENGGTVHNKGSVNLSAGSNHTAIDVNNGHVVNTGDILANGTAIHIKGADSTIVNSGKIEAVDGLAAIHVDAGAGLDLGAVSGNGTIVAKGSADGILLDTGATSLNVANTIIDMTDPSSVGIGIHNVAGIEGIQLDNTQINLGGIGIKTGVSLAKTNTGSISVTNGTGILFQNEDGSAVSTDLDMSDSEDLVINVTSSGDGVKAILDGNDRTVKTGASVNVLNASGKSAVDISGADTVANSGKLTSQSTIANGSVMNVHDAVNISNSGTIAAIDATLAAIDMSNSGDKTFTNTGDITGLLDFTTGNNSIALADGTVTGSILAADGDNELNATGGSVHAGEVLLGDGANMLTVDAATLGDIRTGNGNNSVLLQNNARMGSFVAASGGENNVTVRDTSTFTTLDAGTGGVNDSLTFDNSDYTLTQVSDIQHFDLLNLKNGADFTTAERIQMGDTATSSGRIAIDGSSSLVFNPVAAYTLDHALTGTGLVDVKSGSVFDFDAKTGNQFAGNVQMNSSEFALKDFNTSALTNAVLTAMGRNTTTVGNGVQNIGGLVFNGGTLNFGTTIPNTAVSDNFIEAGKLDASGTGKVQIDHSGFDNATPPVVNKTLGLLDQQHETLVQLASATTVSGEAGNLELIDENGTAISNGSVSEVQQNGVHAADAHYDYRLTTRSKAGNADGLYVGYGLTQLDLLTNDADSLVINTADSVEKVLSAKVTGTGDLGILAGTGADALTLSNLDNSYSGVTDLQTGELIVGTNNALGQTSELHMHNGTGVDLNGKSQTIGILNAESNTLLDFNGGALTVTNGGDVNGQLEGNGQLNLTGNTLNVTENNQQFHGDTSISNGATAHLNQSQGLGDGAISNEGLLHLDGAVGTLLNNLKGSQGDVLLTQGADITLAGNNSDFAGTFTVEEDTTLTGTAAEQLGTAAVHNDGTLVLNTADLWKLENTVDGRGEFIKRGTGTVQLDGSNVTAGLTRIDNGMLVVGSGADTSGATLNSPVNIGIDGTLAGYGQVNGDVTNSGKLVMGGALTDGAVGTFTIHGNYTGNNGTLMFNTALGDDNSQTDKLVVTGDTTGQTSISVKNAHGAGATTTEGIKLIDVAGRSDGEFALKGRAVAGAYEYFLNKGGISNPADGDWYLRSALVEPSPGPEPTPAPEPTPEPIPEPVPAPEPQPTPKPVPTPKPAPIVRPEAGSYMANMAASNMFNLRLEDREGRAENSSMWLRQQGNRNKFHDTSAQLATASNTYVIQGGGEIAEAHFSETDRLGVGVMLGYGNSHSETHSDKTGYRSKGSVDGYSGGVYGTWYQNAETFDGVYIDTWAQYSFFDAGVNGEQLEGESYDMDGFSASVESGYRIPIYRGQNGDVFVTPQVQVTWNGIKADDHTEANGTKVESAGNNNVQTRVGVKLSRDGVSTMDKGKDKLFTTYVEANWLHNTESAGVSLDGTTLKQAGNSNIGELKVGLEGQLNKNVNLWTNVTQQVGDKGYNDIAATIGFKYKF